MGFSLMMTNDSAKMHRFLQTAMTIFCCWWKTTIQYDAWLISDCQFSKGFVTNWKCVKWYSNSNRSISNCIFAFDWFAKWMGGTLPKNIRKMVTTKTNKRENMSLIKNQRNSSYFSVISDEKIVFTIKIVVFGMLNIYKCAI